MDGSEQHFRETLGPNRASVLLQCLHDGIARARIEAVRMGVVEARTEPTLAFDFVTGLLDGRFDALEGVRRAESEGQHLWVVDDFFAIRVKKMTAGYRASNHESRQQDRIANQMALAGFPKLVFVTAGGQFSPRTGLVEEYAIVKHVKLGKSKVVEWAVDLEELADGGLVPAVPTLPIADIEIDVPAATTRSRRNRRETEGGEKSVQG